MDTLEIEKIYESYYRLVKQTPTFFHRDLWNDIDWEDTLIGIKGPRGVGKSTLIRQFIKEHFSDVNKALYVSLDNLIFCDGGNLDDIIDYHYSHGGTHLFLDEVHKFPQWQTKIKNIVDDYTDLHVIYTGSSMLQIDDAKGDLSRRQLLYDLHPMSFREYLAFENILNVEAISLEDLLLNHTKIAMDITAKVKILPIFEKYLVSGQYPFYKSIHSGYQERLKETVLQVLESDLPAVETVSYATIQMVKKMLLILVEKIPQIVNMSALYEELGTTRDLGLKMLYALERAGILSLLTTESKSYKKMARPAKIYLGSTNLMYVLSPFIDKGTLRETYFHSCIDDANKEILLPNTGNFIVDRKYLFEVGGKGKTFAQIKDIPESFLAVDDTEIGHGSRIPLWMFGLLR